MCTKKSKGQREFKTALHIQVNVWAMTLFVEAIYIVLYLISMAVSRYYFPIGTYILVLIMELAGLALSFYFTCVMGSYSNFGNATGVTPGNAHEHTGAHDNGNVNPAA